MDAMTTGSQRGAMEAIGSSSTNWQNGVGGPSGPRRARPGDVNGSAETPAASWNTSTVTFPRISGAAS
jgi:hypothetical protein